MSGTYLGAEQPMVDLWVEARLATVAAELDAIAAGLSSRIYNAVAPTGVPYPFIVYQTQSPPRDVRGVGLARVLVDTLYLVKAVAQATDYVGLAPIARVIDSAMTFGEVSPVEDGFVLTSFREDQFSLVEVASGTQYRNLGGQYRIQAQSQQ